MSAIAGVWHTDGKPRAHAELGQMIDALAMYGSDHRAAIELGDVALGRCLMHLLPQDCHDRQPLVVEPEHSWLVADVRLDNREELSRKLRLPASSLNQECDAWLLLAAWREWREDCLQHLTGAFCFAVWDARLRQLFLARDHAGARPLFYHRSRGRFAFATMPKGLLCLPGLDVRLDEEQLAVYLALGRTPGRSMFVGIDRLPPGHYLQATAATVRVVRYWQPDDAPAIRFRRDGDYSDAFRERFDAVVQAQLRASGNVAAYLSGGLDSSSVAATAARTLAAQGRELLAFTAVPRPEFGTVPKGRFGDEGTAAARVAALHLNMRHVRVSSEHYRMLDAIAKSCRLDDVPLFNPLNGKWLHTIRDVARQSNTRVLLSGQSGNATLSYAGTDALAEWFAHGRWLTLARCSTALVRNGYSRPRSIIAGCIRPWLPAALQSPLRRRVSAFSLVHPDLVQRFNLWERSAMGAPLGIEARATARLLLMHSDLAEVATGTRAGWHIDERDPTRDRRIIEFCFGIPPEQFLAGGQTRALVRRAMRDRLPEATLACRERGLQSADWYSSLSAERAALEHELARLQGSPIARRCLDLERMQLLLEAWPGADAARPLDLASWPQALTRGLSVGHFIRNFDPDADLPSFTTPVEHHHELHPR